MASGERNEGESYSEYRARLRGEETRTRQVVVNGSPRIQLWMVELERQRQLKMKRRNFRIWCIVIAVDILIVGGVVWYLIW